MIHFLIPLHATTRTVIFLISQEAARVLALILEEYVLGGRGGRGARRQANQRWHGSQHSSTVYQWRLHKGSVRLISGLKSGLQ